MAGLEEQQGEFAHGAAAGKSAEPAEQPSAPTSERTSPVSDERAAQLLASTNEAAGLVQKVYFTYLLVSLYLAVLIGSTTHEQLLRESGIPLPIFGVPLSVFWVYALAPWLYVALHVNLLVQHYLLSRKLHRFSVAVAGRDDEHEWRIRLYPSLFAQMLAGAEPTTIKRLVLRSTVFMTVVAAPLVLLVWMQVQFLPYHHQMVTWATRIAVWVDLFLIWYYWPPMDEVDGKWRAFSHRRDHESRVEWRPLRPMLGVAFSGFIFFVATFVAVVPGGLVERLTASVAEPTPDAWWKGNAAFGAGVGCVVARVGNGTRVLVSDRSAPTGAGQTDAPQESVSWLGRTTAWFRASVPRCIRNVDLRACLPRHLEVREAKLVERDAPPELVAALVTQEDREAKERQWMAGLVLEGRDLRGAIFRHANLTKADLEGADLSGANLGCTTLVDANLAGTVLVGSDLSEAKLHHAKLHGTTLHDTVLDEAKLLGAELRGVTLQASTSRAADFSHATFKNVSLIGADLAGRSLKGADLRGAELVGANLSGADLEGAKLGGADLRAANLGRANLSAAEFPGADLRGADLRKAVVDGVDFKQAKFHFADLRSVVYSDGSFSSRLDSIGGTFFGDENLCKEFSKAQRAGDSPSPDQRKSKRQASTGGYGTKFSNIKSGETVGLANEDKGQQCLYGLSIVWKKVDEIERALELCRGLEIEDRESLVQSLQAHRLTDYSALSPVPLALAKAATGCFSSGSTAAVIADSITNLEEHLERWRQLTLVSSSD